MNLFPRRLKWLREKHGYTQSQMAEMLEISQSYYNRFEKGTGEPNMQTLLKLRHILGQSLDFLVGYEFEDIHALNLYDFYAEARFGRIEIEEDLEYSDELLSAATGEEFDRRMDRIKKLKDELKGFKAKEEKFLNQFLEHIATIPGYDKDKMTKEFWIDNYDEYRKNERESRIIFDEAFWDVRFDGERIIHKDKDPQ